MKTFLVAASCGLVLLGAVAAQAGIATNGVDPKGVNLNGINLHGLTTPVPSANTIGTPPSQGLPLHSFSKSGLGKPAVDARTP